MVHFSPSVADEHGRTVLRCSLSDHVEMPQVSFPSSLFRDVDVQGSVECFWSASDHVSTPQLAEADCAWSALVTEYVAHRAIRLMQAVRRCRGVIAVSSF
jgi:hypothetical protein